MIVATTRIETMLGDTAVAVHPEDSRYKVKPEFPIQRLYKCIKIGLGDKMIIITIFILHNDNTFSVS